MLNRYPAVAGTFYESSPAKLREEVASLLGPYPTQDYVPVIISPHAGLMYSGHVAGSVYSRILIPDTVILIGPNHTGRGPVLSVFPEGTWHIPGAKVSIDISLVERLLDEMPLMQPDQSAHQYEHCLEVQLPFLCHLRENIKIVPLLLATKDLNLCMNLAHCLTKVLPTKGAADAPPPLVVATTDFNHYESDQITREKDRFALEAIQDLNPETLHHQVHQHRISMCGLGPTVTALQFAKELGIPRGHLVRYATSGDISGDRNRVVGYGGFLFANPERRRENSLVI